MLRLLGHYYSRAFLPVLLASCWIGHPPARPCPVRPLVLLCPANNLMLTDLELESLPAPIQRVLAKETPAAREVDGGARRRPGRQAWRTS